MTYLNEETRKKMNTILKNRDLDFVDSENSKSIVSEVRATLIEMEARSPYNNGFKYQNELRNLSEIMKDYSNKVSTMRDENSTAKDLLNTEQLIGLKDDLPRSEYGLFNKISGWMEIKTLTDRYKDDYEFYSDKAESTIKNFKDKVENNNYIVCGELKKAQYNASIMNLDDHNMLVRMESDYKSEGFNAKCFRDIKAGIESLKNYKELNESFKTPRMEYMAKEFEKFIDDFKPIAAELKNNGEISKLSPIKNEINEFNIFHITNEIDDNLINSYRSKNKI